MYDTYSFERLIKDLTLMYAKQEFANREAVKKNPGLGKLMQT